MDALENTKQRQKLEQGGLGQGGAVWGKGRGGGRATVAWAKVQFCQMKAVEVNRDDGCTQGSAQCHWEPPKGQAFGTSDETALSIHASHS